MNFRITTFLTVIAVFISILASCRKDPMSSLMPDDDESGAVSSASTSTAAGISSISSWNTSSMWGWSSSSMSSMSWGYTSSTASVPSVTPTAPEPEQTDFFFFSYDDSASTAAVELVKYALYNGQTVNPSLARPYEFLNYEDFDPDGYTDLGLFNLSMGIWQHDIYQDTSNTAFTFGAYLSSPFIDKAARDNVVLTLVVDVSGSMLSSAGSYTYNGVEGTDWSKMRLAKDGMQVLLSQLKQGDVINIVSFQSTASVCLQDWNYSWNTSSYLNAVNSLSAGGSTALEAGINLAYQLAHASFDPTKHNRVIMLTDAYANVGQTDSSVISSSTMINNMEGIYFSGLGYGYDFNEAFLNELTEAGKGAYYSIISKCDSDRAFSDRFIGLVNVAARDVQFKLEYPGFLSHGESGSEEHSTEASEVQTINFSYNTSQFFIETFYAPVETSPVGNFTLTIEYTDPVTGQMRTESETASMASLIGQNVANIKDAYTITLLTSLISGAKSSEEVDWYLSGPLAGHSSPLFNEYTGLIARVNP